MNNKSSVQSGYILVLTLLLISITILIVSKLSQQSFVQRGYDTTQIERQQAQELALSGIQCAMSQLAYQKAEEGKKEGDHKLTLLKKMLPLFLREQSFALKQAADGIDGELRITIIPEEGKFNINRWYDVEKKQFADDAARNIAKKLFELIGKKTKEATLFEDFERFLKNRGRKIDDPTELLEIPSFAKVFGAVPSYPALAQQNKSALFIADLFTVDSSSASPNPWILSDAVRATLGLKRIEEKEGAKSLQEISSSLKTLPTDIKTLWQSYLAKLYGKELVALPQELQTAFNSTLFFKNFTVVSYGKAGQTGVYVTALLERIDDVSFIIKRLYWH